VPQAYVRRMATKKWSDLSDSQKTAVLVLVSVELSLTATALVDLARRPAAQVRGRKGVWALAIFVQPVGPIAYLAWGAHAPRAA
jgi:Phospholipase_D-nuclease N-terminal